MNAWGEIRKVAIVESDDTCDHWSRNGINFLFYWKSKYPKFKISLFVIPNRTSKEMLKLLESHKDWIELLVHGFDHESNFECYGWDYDRAMRLLERIESFGAYKKIFKAPGWTITPDLCGYPSGPDQLITKDKQAVYKALRDRNYIVTDRHYNNPRRLEDANYICIDCNPDIVHMHTWNMETGDKNGRNGYQQVIEEHGEPWDYNTEFIFMSEAWEKGMFLPCRK
jgi:hypothetical protein